jgi:hypothetical protein
VSFHNYILKYVYFDKTLYLTTYNVSAVAVNSTSISLGSGIVCLYTLTYINIFYNLFKLIVSLALQKHRNTHFPTKIMEPRLSKSRIFKFV